MRAVMDSVFGSCTMCQLSTLIVPQHLRKPASDNSHGRKLLTRFFFRDKLIAIEVLVSRRSTSQYYDLAVLESSKLLELPNIRTFDYQYTFIVQVSDAENESYTIY